MPLAPSSSGLGFYGVPVQTSYVPEGTAYPVATSVCPNDTDGDGNCGRVGCPTCRPRPLARGGFIGAGTALRSGTLQTTSVDAGFTNGVIGYVRRMARRRRVKCQPRDANGRWVKRARWWRPRDRRGQFLPLDPERRDHDEEARDILRAEAGMQRAVQSMRRFEQQFRVTAAAATTLSSNFIGSVNNTAISGTTISGNGIYANAGTAYLDGAQIGRIENIEFNATPTNAYDDDYRLTTQTTSSYNIAAYVPSRRNPEITARIEYGHLLDSSPDPDREIGNLYDELRRRLEDEIVSRYGGSQEEVWRNWTVEARSITPDWNARDTYQRWAIELQARYHGRNIREDRDTWAAVQPTNTTWDEWARGVPVHSGDHSVVPPRPSQAELREKARRDEWQRRHNALVATTRERSRSLRRRIADRRAEQLLRSCLTEEQCADLDRANGFRVISSDGRAYWVARGYAGNVYLLDGRGHERSNRVASYCIHAPSSIPDADQMLSQKLMLETDVQTFRRVANERRLRVA